MSESARALKSSLHGSSVGHSASFLFPTLSFFQGSTVNGEVIDINGEDYHRDASQRQNKISCRTDRNSGA